VRRSCLHDRRQERQQRGKDELPHPPRSCSR
jgi:hypothetical protein